jgi:hypothetical protein
VHKLQRAELHKNFIHYWHRGVLPWHPNVTSASFHMMHSVLHARSSLAVLIHDYMSNCREVTASRHFQRDRVWQNRQKSLYFFKVSCITFIITACTSNAATVGWSSDGPHRTPIHCKNWHQPNDDGCSDGTNLMPTEQWLSWMHTRLAPEIHVSCPVRNPGGAHDRGKEDAKLFFALQPGVPHAWGIASSLSLYTNG